MAVTLQHDGLPPERQYLTSAEPRSCRDGKSHPVVGGDRCEELGHVVGGRDLELGSLELRRRHTVERVHTHRAPTDRLLECSPQDRTDLDYRASREAGGEGLVDDALHMDRPNVADLHGTDTWRDLAPHVSAVDRRGLWADLPDRDAAYTLGSPRRVGVHKGR
jgi:hypothetical protein